MAHIEDRWYDTVRTSDGDRREKSKLYGKGLRYRVRYIAPDGKERSKSFPDKARRDAVAFMANVETDKLRGTYIDPAAGRLTLRAYATEWIASASCDEPTRELYEREFRLHVFPSLGDRALASIQPETVRNWSHGLKGAGLSDNSRRLVFQQLSMVLNAAVDDRRMVSNPCAARTVRPPRYQPVDVVPWTAECRARFRVGVTPRYRVAVDLGAGCGLRQGEIFAVSPDDLDDVRPVLHVQRQIRIVRGRLVFALPKGRKTRDVPLPSSVAERLKAHAQRYPSLLVTLPWGTPTGPPVTVRLYLFSSVGTPLIRTGFNTNVWRPALKRAGIEVKRQNAMHVLRHTYASVLLDGGESVKALAAYLGHSDPGFTLRIYTHLMPTSESRTRSAIDRALANDDDDPADLTA